ncbi:hypothetical protein SORBI_3003G386350 [Sorghum bicolor]|uniref:Uncharacterized protein n=1 Tax=Sorghum bicolor TaxID=4558 RepID=A0A1W0W0X4_SORBI|nr:hypothetical protein SORBI_3003G386350 [Sorghum bicolor]
MGDALVINLMMNGNVGYSRSRSRGGGDGDDEEPTPRSGSISPARKLFARAFGVVFGIAMAIFTIVAKEEDSNFVMKGICLTASLVVALFPFVLTQDDA